MGTSSGHLKKLLLSKRILAEEFEEIEIDNGHSILPDIYVDGSQQYVYVSSPYKISKISIEQCKQYNSCRDCLQARNPYCGWCSLERRCTIKSACYYSSDLTPTERNSTGSRWLSLDTQQCIGFQSIKPERLPINKVQTIELVINELPSLPPSAKYLCVFGDTLYTSASVTTKGLICSNPPLSSRPKISSGNDHVTIDLAVRSTETKTDFLHRPYIFYDCSVHKTCKNCLKSKWNCNWCLHDNVCSSDTSSCTRISDAKRTTSIFSSLPSSSINALQSCPSIGYNEEILLPNGVGKEITLLVKNLPNPQDGYQCLLEYEGNQVKVKARTEQNRIICQSHSYSYQSNIPSIQASLTLLWKSDTIIDKTNVTLYKCQLLGSHNNKADCSLCQATMKKFSCAWCSGQCSHMTQCSGSPLFSCPKPRIDWIHPLSGPIDGGTLVAIEGSNLGSSFEEIRDKITIGNKPCTPTDYSTSVRIVCRTSPSSVGEQSASIVIGNMAGQVTAQEKFQYKRIELDSVNPKIGPKSGGTRLYLMGSNFNIGSNVEVYLDDLQCEIKKTMIANKQITCRTQASTFSPRTINKLKLNIDGTTLTLSKPFTYVDDPIIERITPARSFISGGRSLTVFGKGFNSIQKPKIGIYKNQMILNDTICKVINDTQMECPSPSVEEEAAILIRDYVRDDSYSMLTQKEFKYQIGFEMDDVHSVKDLGKYFPKLNSHINYVPDPKFFTFKNNGVKLYKGESLVIEGENLNLALSETEINVQIGNKPCNITSLTMTQLVCLPPQSLHSFDEGELNSDNERNSPSVIVYVGHNLQFKVGNLKYDIETSNDIPPLLITLLCSLGALLILLSFILLAIFRHKSSQAEREYKRIQLQMDTLENSVRLECKQAFAELQTDLTDLNNDIELSGIPLLDHKTYTMKIFFPGLSENPLSGYYKTLNGDEKYTEDTMIQFEDLIYTKSFLLAFINTLENQKTFTIRDRVNVASLLMIILSDKMDYAFEILRELLLKLIDKYANSKHPHLLLRRTEYVVEKMLVNWMAICMYNYVKVDAGRTLFLLFSAIKHQIEKGPIDAITHDARYSLSEERLLREQIDYSTILLNVIYENQIEKYQCRVLDCDTISQVKGKILDTIYKNTPSTQRPSLNDVQLEWLEGHNRRLILSDEDLTSKTYAGWKKFNTLGHYGVTDGAVMCLCLKRRTTTAITTSGTTHHLLRSGRYTSIDTTNSSQTSRDSSSSGNNSHHYYMSIGKNNNPLTRSNSNLNKNFDNHQIRYWHLVKNLDDTTNNSKDNQSHKAIPEIFLTRLLSSKGTIQKYVDDFISSVLTVNDKLPPAVRWLFHLFDKCALEYGITDPEVVYAWKCNSLPLRFWVNLVKNPDFLFDIEKSPAVDSCLSVVAQAFMDACSTNEHRLGKESPSSKLLFARDMPIYRKMVSKFYNDVAETPQVSDEEMLMVMRDISLYCGEVDTRNAIKELYVYVARYREELLETLYSDI